MKSAIFVSQWEYPGLFTLYFKNKAKRDLFATGLKICELNLVGLGTFLNRERQTDRQTLLCLSFASKVNE